MYDHSALLPWLAGLGRKVKGSIIRYIILFRIMYRIKVETLVNPIHDATEIMKYVYSIDV